MTDTAAIYEGADPIPGDFYDLLKPRVMSLVVFTALAGALLAPGTLHPLLLVLSIAAIAVGAGASGALNMVFDADIDAIMSRTRTRPLPSGRVSRDAALSFGIVLSAGSVMVLAFASNYVAAALLAFTIFFYVVIYTLVLKRRTPQNIVIGGAAGALPPVVGWAAVTGDVTLVPLVMFGIIFLWTPAHFWALAILKRDDYALAGIPMLPCVASAKSTRRQILFYAVLTALSGPSLTLIGAASWGYGVVAAGLGVWFVARAIALLNATDETERYNAGRLFGVSIVYLFALFGALMADHIITMVLA